MNIKDIAKEVRGELKEKFPNVKFSVTIERYSGGQSMDIALMEASFDVFDSLVDCNGNIRIREYAQLNYHSILNKLRGSGLCNGSYLTQEAWDIFQKVIEIGLKRNWDNSDSQTDYYDVNYWFDIGIGKWDKPFIRRS